MNIVNNLNKSVVLWIICVYRKKDGTITFEDDLTLLGRLGNRTIDLLETVFCDGELLRDETLAEIRARLANA